MDGRSGVQGVLDDIDLRLPPFDNQDEMVNELCCGADVDQGGQRRKVDDDVVVTRPQPIEELVHRVCGKQFAAVQQVAPPNGRQECEVRCRVPPDCFFDRLAAIGDLDYAGGSS